MLTGTCVFPSSGQVIKTSTDSPTDFPRIFRNKYSISKVARFSTLTPLDRMQYPEYYKTDRTTITKFDRDYNQEIMYSFVGLFPFQISSIPVSYNGSDTLKMSASFYYDRYIAGKSLSLNEFNGDNNNNKSDQAPNPFSVAFDGGGVDPRINAGIDSQISIEDSLRIGKDLNLSRFGANTITNFFEINN